MLERFAIIAAAGVLLGSTGLTTIGAIIGVIGGVAGVCAFFMLLRLKKSVDELERIVDQAVHRTEEAQPPPTDED